MSWFARSIVNTLNGGDSGGSSAGSADGDPEPEHRAGEEDEQHPDISSRGVKEDLSELKKTLTRQFWGVANFLAPPADSSSPLPSSAAADPPPAAGGSPRMAGIRSDFAEIGGRVRSGISLLSSNLPVSEISKITSNFLSFGMDDGREDDEEEGYDGARDQDTTAIGVTEEVLAFARNISMHPETWLDFPLLVNDDECDDFDISDAQQEHALAVERFAPRLAALRIELCPSHMSEGCFWKIYFVLLHPRLNKHDAELLSTPQIVEARAKLQRLQSRRKQELESSEGVPYRKELLSHVSFGENVPQSSVSSEAAATPMTPLIEESTTIPVIACETEKHPVFTSELQIIDKSVIEESPSSQTKKEISEDSKVTIHKYENTEDEDDGDDEWLKEETGDASGSAATHVALGNEDVSFSDLEEDYDQLMPKATKAIAVPTDSL